MVAELQAALGSTAQDLAETAEAREALRRWSVSERDACAQLTADLTAAGTARAAAEDALHVEAVQYARQRALWVRADAADPQETRARRKAGEKGETVFLRAKLTILNLYSL